MKTFDRRSEIIRIIKEQQRTSTSTLSELLDVSEVTIRNDLKVLAAQGWLHRVHGGAEITPEFVPEQPFADRQREHASAKESIAIAAATMIRPGDTILLDSSTTAFQLALELKQIPWELNVVTNNLHAAMTLKDCPKLEVLMLGGVIRGETFSAIGSMARDMLAKIHVHKGFISANGLTVERGLAGADIREVETQRAMVQSAQQVIALIDSSKFGKTSFLSVASLNEINLLVTEKEVPPEFLESLQGQGVQIHIAKTHSGDKNVRKALG
jgi:DeoR/GlpR family transcriptional regulator of sugar metabolism